MSYRRHNESLAGHLVGTLVILSMTLLVGCADGPDITTVAIFDLAFPLILAGGAFRPRRPKPSQAPHSSPTKSGQQCRSEGPFARRLRTVAVGRGRQVDLRNPKGQHQRRGSG